jgi:hypothetical protein
MRHNIFKIRRNSFLHYFEVEMSERVRWNESRDENNFLIIIAVVTFVHRHQWLSKSHLENKVTEGRSELLQGE